MGERRGHPAVVAIVIGLVTLAGVTLLGIGAVLVYTDALAASWAYEKHPDHGGGARLAGLTALFLLGGRWWAWRVGSGRWNFWFRRRRTPAHAPAPDPAVFAPHPTCGRTVDQQVGRCPCCRSDLA
jgi:hypothetical protein